MKHRGGAALKPFRIGRDIWGGGFGRRAKNPPPHRQKRGLTLGKTKLLDRGGNRGPGGLPRVAWGGEKKERMAEKSKAS